MILLHPYAPGVRPADQCRTWEALAALPLPEDDRRWDRPCTDELDYARWLALAEAADSYVMIVEHDIAPTVAQWAELWDCGEDFCAWDYLVERDLLWSQIDGGLGLGFSCISFRAWQQVVETPHVPLVGWKELAGALRDRLPPVHLHRGPVQHNHRY